MKATFPIALFVSLFITSPVLAQQPREVEGNETVVVDPAISKA